MFKNLLAAITVLVSGVIIVAYLVGKHQDEQLKAVAPRVSMSRDMLLALGDGVAAKSQVSIGTARRIVYLLACSGLPSYPTMAPMADMAAAVTRTRNWSEERAVADVLTMQATPAAIAAALDGC